jgi:hypothetical protein
MMDTWTRYTVTATLGIIAGVVVTFGHYTFSNAQEIAVAKERYEIILRRLDRIDEKLALPKK